MTSARRSRRLVLLLSLPLAAVLALMTPGSDGAGAAPTDVAQAGHDLLETDSSVTYHDFSGSPIPADFFGPGSDPFADTVALEGVPFDSFGAFSGLLPTDTIVERLQDAGPGFPDTIDIEIVRLELKSVDPITVTYNGGLDPELWDMTMQVLEGPVPAQSTGTMTIRHEFADGGTFDSVLPVTPRFTFTRISPPMGPMWIDGPTVNFQATNVPWCHTANPLDDPPGHVVVEVGGLTSNFFPGIDCGAPRVKGLVTEQATFAAHGVRSAEVVVATAAQAGHDLLETDSSVTYQDFSGSPIPADFFGPGSDPFADTVVLEGVPFDAFGAFSGLSPTDTIVERLQDAGTVGFPDTIDIEIVRLELKSVDPITVTYNGGQSPELWDMTVQVLEGPIPAQSTGTMTIRHEFADGGTFDSVLPVTPRFSFTRISPPMGPMWIDGPTVNFQATNVPWCHTASPLHDPAGHVVVEVAGLTSNFFPGITCQPTRTKGLVTETALLAQHGVRPAENAAVGGIDVLPALAATEAGHSSAAAGGSGWSAGAYAALGGGVALLLVTVAAGALYTRRRFSRS